MQIAVIGTGNVGAALGKRWAEGGHRVVFGTRDPESAKVTALVEAAGPNASADRIANATARAEVVLLAVPWDVVRLVLENAGELSGKVLIDATNPIAPAGLAVGFDTSGGELVAEWAPGARVVKAFNTTGANNLADSRYGDVRPSMFLCGDDAAAKQIAGELAGEIGFEAIDAGALSLARVLEPLTVLWVSLAHRQGLGRNIAFSLLRR